MNYKCFKGNLDSEKKDEFKKVSKCSGKVNFRWPI